MNSGRCGISASIGQGQFRGRLRVTAFPPFASRFIVPRLPEFLAIYPEVSIDLDVSERLVARFSQSNADRRGARAETERAAEGSVRSRQAAQRSDPQDDPRGLSEAATLAYLVGQVHLRFAQQG